MSAVSSRGSESSQDMSEISVTPESPGTAILKSISNTAHPTGNVTFSNPMMDVTTPTMSQAKSDALQKRRSSSRSIKRKKFDDELVESSLIKTSRARPMTASLPGSSGTPRLGISTGSGPGEDGISQELHGGPIAEKRKPSKSAPKRVKKNKNSHAMAVKDLGRWKPADDLALILAVQQTNDLEMVHRGMKFSCKFTLQEIQERWYALLYDPVISKVAVNAMKQLHPEVIAQVHSRALFSDDEEELLGTIPSTSQPSLETFQELLNKHPDIFMVLRTAKSLFAHWTLMKQYQLLPDQKVKPFPSGDQVLHFSDAEEMLEDLELALSETKDDVLEYELALADRKAKREIRQLENELPKWQVLVDSITGVSPPDFDSQTLAVLRGRLVRYLMRSREISLGRSTKDNNIDVDLSLEGPAWKVSRKQGSIKLKNTGDFLISNEGKRPIYVDGRPVLSGYSHKLNNNSVVEIAGLRFIFLINQDLIATLRADAAKAVS